MSERDEMERAARRAFPPESGRELDVALGVIGVIASREDDFDVLSLDVMDAMETVPVLLTICVGDGRVADLLFLSDDGEVTSLGDGFPRGRMIARALPEEFRCPELRSPSPEDARRIQDLADIRGGVSLRDARPLAPSADPQEAAEWLAAACETGGITLVDGVVQPNEDPRSPNLDIATLGDNCPVQGEGTINGVGFYYSARGSWQSIETDDGFEMRERVIGGPYDAGWVSLDESTEFVTRAALAYERSRFAISERISGQDGEEGNLG